MLTKSLCVACSTTRTPVTIAKTEILSTRQRHDRNYICLGSYNYVSSDSNIQLKATGVMCMRLLLITYMHQLRTQFIVCANVAGASVCKAQKQKHLLIVVSLSLFHLSLANALDLNASVCFYNFHIGCVWMGHVMSVCSTRGSTQICM